MVSPELSPWSGGEYWNYYTGSYDTSASAVELFGQFYGNPKLVDMTGTFPSYQDPQTDDVVDSESTTDQSVVQMEKAASAESGGDGARRGAIALPTGKMPVRRWDITFSDGSKDTRIGRFGGIFWYGREKQIRLLVEGRGVVEVLLSWLSADDRAWVENWEKENTERTWTSTKGTTVVATFDSVEKINGVWVVHLKAPGATYDPRISQLSPQDVAFLKSLDSVKQALELDKIKTAGQPRYIRSTYTQPRVSMPVSKKTSALKSWGGLRIDGIDQGRPKFQVLAESLAVQCTGTDGKTYTYYRAKIEISLLGFEILLNQSLDAFNLEQTEEHERKHAQAVVDDLNKVIAGDGKGTYLGLDGLPLVADKAKLDKFLEGFTEDLKKALMEVLSREAERQKNENHDDHLGKPYLKEEEFYGHRRVTQSAKTYEPNRSQSDVNRRRDAKDAAVEAALEVVRTASAVLRAMR